MNEGDAAQLSLFDSSDDNCTACKSSADSYFWYNEEPLQALPLLLLLLLYYNYDHDHGNDDYYSSGKCVLLCVLAACGMTGPRLWS